jgi:hypothetical protein
VRTATGAPAIASLYVIRRKYLTRGTSTYEPGQEKCCQVTFLTEPAEQPELVQVSVSVLPPTLGGRAEGPCEVFASYQGFEGLVLRGRQHRRFELADAFSRHADRFSCDDEADGAPFPVPSVLRFPRVLSGKAPLARLCAARTRASEPLFRQLQRGMDDAMYANAAWAAVRLAELNQDFARGIRLQSGSAHESQAYADAVTAQAAALSDLAITLGDPAEDVPAMRTAVEHSNDASDRVFVLEARMGLNEC